MKRDVVPAAAVIEFVALWDLGAIASAVGGALRERAHPEMKRRAKELILDPDLDNVWRLQLLSKALADAPDAWCSTTSSRT